MAVDEALLQSAATSAQATLRFYQWSEPTLSLGYFQAIADRERHAASRSCAVVRRSTGGGAIMHDHELTYSFVAPIGDHLARDVEGLYRVFHETLVAALAGHPHILNQNQPCEEQPFLCFQRRAKNDVLLGENKIAGSAQRRHYGAVLQHGSVLLIRSSFAPELPGLVDLLEDLIPAQAILQRWIPAIAARLHLSLSPSDLTADEFDLATELATTKYGSPPWTSRR